MSDKTYVKRCMFSTNGKIFYELEMKNKFILEHMAWFDVASCTVYAQMNNPQRVSVGPTESQLVFIN